MLRAYSSVGVAKYITLGFLSLILAGALLLWGFNYLFGPVIGLLDAFFLSASAVCVTGLSAFNVGETLSPPSQLVLLCLIQFGGIGIMGATTVLAVLAGQRLQVRDSLYLAGGLGVDTPRGVGRLLRLVFLYTALFESVGAAVLFIQFAGMGYPILRALYHAIFHSVSAFCSAGISLYPASLEQFQTALIVPGTIMILMTIGSLGFPVLTELRDFRQGRIRFLSPYAKIVLYSTAAFILVGTVVITASEWNTAFAGLPYWARCWNGLFGCVNARAAGFYMVPYSTWTAEGLLITIFLMFIGASPASTGGGLKTTTFAVLLCVAWSELKQQDDVMAFGRRIGTATMRRALTLAFIYIFTLFVFSGILSILETAPFSTLLFEAVSALGTAGLSRGITGDLSNLGKMVIVLLMFWGRVGIFTFSYSLIPREKKENVSYPETQIPVG